MKPPIRSKKDGCKYPLAGGNGGIDAGDFNKMSKQDGKRPRLSFGNSGNKTGQGTESDMILKAGIADYSDRIAKMSREYLDDPDPKAAHLAKQLVFLSGRLEEAAKKGNRAEILKAMDGLFNHTADFLSGHKRANERMEHMLDAIGDTQSRLGAILEFYRTKKQVKSIDEAHW